jgi:threonine synthase
VLPSHLECSRDANHRYSAGEPATVCAHDGAPLLVRYGAERMSRKTVAPRAWTMWRYREMLPIAADEEPISLGEGATPLLRVGRLASELGIDDLYVKDESQNPTGSFKARGMSVAVTVAKRLGATAFVAPSTARAPVCRCASTFRATRPRC